MVDLSGLEGLTGRGGDISAKVDFLRDVLPDYFNEGYSYKAALADLRANDFSIGTNLFSLVARQVEGIASPSGYLGGLVSDYFPSENDLYNNPQRQDSRYKFVYVVKAEDSETGETFYQNFSIQMDSFGSIGELRDLGQQFLSERYPQLAEQKLSISLAYGLRAQ